MLHFFCFNFYQPKFIIKTIKQNKIIGKAKYKLQLFLKLTKKFINLITIRQRNAFLCSLIYHHYHHKPSSNIFNSTLSTQNLLPSNIHFSSFLFHFLLSLDTLSFIQSNHLSFSSLHLTYFSSPSLPFILFLSSFFLHFIHCIYTFALLVALFVYNFLFTSFIIQPLLFPSVTLSLQIKFKQLINIFPVHLPILDKLEPKAKLEK